MCKDRKYHLFFIQLIFSRNYIFVDNIDYTVLKIIIL